MCGFFTENGLIGMIQASFMDSIDHVSPFPAVIVDVMCGNESSPGITALVNLCVNLRIFLHKDGLSTFWNEQELDSICKKNEGLQSNRPKSFLIIPGFEYGYIKVAPA